MKINKLQKGMAELVVILVILAGVAAVVYLVAKPSFMKSDAAIPTTIPRPSVTGKPSEFPAKDVTTEVPAINNKADLTERLKELDNEKVDDVLLKVFENDKDVNSL